MFDFTGSFWIAVLAALTIGVVGLAGYQVTQPVTPVSSVMPISQNPVYLAALVHADLWRKATLAGNFREAKLQQQMTKDVVDILGNEAPEEARLIAYSRE